MRGIEQIIELNTGGSKTDKVEKELRLTIKLLAQRKHSRSELIEELNLDRHYKDPGKKLDDLLAILRGKDREIGCRILFDQTLDGEKYYELDISRCTGNLDQVKRNIEYLEESQEVKRGLDDLKADIRELRR